MRAAALKQQNLPVKCSSLCWLNRSWFSLSPNHRSQGSALSCLLLFLASSPTRSFNALPSSCPRDLGFTELGGTIYSTSRKPRSTNTTDSFLFGSILHHTFFSIWANCDSRLPATPLGDLAALTYAPFFRIYIRTSNFWNSPPFSAAILAHTLFAPGFVVVE